MKTRTRQKPIENGWLDEKELEKTGPAPSESRSSAVAAQTLPSPK
jgi:hypothetical protein